VTALVGPRPDVSGLELRSIAATLPTLMVHEDYLHADSPWRVSSALALVRSMGLSIAGIATAWIGCSTTADLVTQTRWLAVGGGALILGGWAMTRWLVLGFREVRSARAALPPRLSGLAHPDAGSLFRAAPTRLYAPAGARHFHRAECQLVVGKKLDQRTLRTFVKQGLSACGVCGP
jgi:hypothetical protein